MNDIQIGRRARSLRQRARLTQEGLSAKTGVSQGSISLLERGRLGGMTVGTMRRVVAGLDAEFVLMLTWRGGDLDRLLDARHARLGDDMARVLSDLHWEVAPEVSYSRYGERGSIDLVAWHAPTDTLLIIELKSEITSIEETLRKHDAKVRLGPTVVGERLGWTPRTVARLLVLPEHRTIRRQIEDKATLFGRAYPDRAFAIRRWLRAPSGPMSGLMFLPEPAVVRGMRGPMARKRVRVSRPSVEGS